MAISINTTYPGKVYAPDANYDQGSIKNETVPDSSDDGTPLDEKWGNDWEGAKQALMKSAGISPTSPGNVPETILLSQVTQSIVELSSGRAFTYDDSGAANVYVFDVQTNQQAPQSLFDGFVARSIIATTNTGASTVNVGGTGVKNIKTQAGADPVAGDLTLNDRVELIYDGTNFVLSGEKGLYINSVQASSGYERIPVKVGGVMKEGIRQWGTDSSAASGTTTITLPIAFPNAVVAVLATHNGATLGSRTVSARSPTTTNFILEGYNSADGVRLVIQIGWEAIGY